MFKLNKSQQTATSACLKRVINLNIIVLFNFYRSQQTATNAKSKGRGTEPDFHYPQWKKIFHNLQKFVFLACMTTFIKSFLS